MDRNPYGKFIAGKDPLRSLEETSARIESLVRSSPRDRDEQSHAPGKWPARRLLTHLVHIELVFSTRLRFALAQPAYDVQPFDQDEWMQVEAPVSALAALDAYLALRRMNLSLCYALTPDQRSKAFSHPEFGGLTVDWLIAWLAGHELNHLPQLEKVYAG